MYLIGIDVGGTHTKFGLIKDGELLKTLKVSTNAFDIIRQVVNGARELSQSAGIPFEDISGVAVGFPGMVIDNIVKESPNIGLQNCNIVDILTSEFDGKPVIAMNDAELAVLAEHRMGAGEDCDNMVLVTIGTGVGGGVIIDKQLYVGKGGAGELGHIVLEKDGRECRCGRKGCAEQYISLTALDRMTRELHPNFLDTRVVLPEGSKIDASELVKAYKVNDSLAITVVDKYVGLLKDYVLNLCNLLRPDKVVIGGGLCHAPEIIDMVAKVCKKESFGFANSPSVDIIPAKLGNEAGILGAVVCFDGIEEMQVDLNKLNASLNDIGTPTLDIENTIQIYDDFQQPYSVYDTPVQENADSSDENSHSIQSDISNGNILDAMYELSNQNNDQDVSYDLDMLNRLNERLKNK